MKSIKFFIIALLFCGTFQMANAQKKKAGNLVVQTKLTETLGSYDQRKLYRDFLTSYMADCPYISNFSVHEAVGSSDNHKVVWEYQVNSWDDITKFYSWVSQHIKQKDETGLRKAMTPFEPDYNIGGKIQVTPFKESMLAKH